VILSGEGENKMKKKTYLIISLLSLLFAGTTIIHAQGSQPDLSMRAALYFTGANAADIDLAKDKYVARDGTMELKRSQASSCDETGCVFNLGFIAFRTEFVRAPLSTYGLFSVENGGVVGNTVYFAIGETTKKGVHAVKLKMGVNKVTFTIDPYKKTNETDENNNSFSANFKVVPDTLLLNKRGVVPKN